MSGVPDLWSTHMTRSTRHVPHPSPRITHAFGIVTLALVFATPLGCGSQSLVTRAPAPVDTELFSVSYAVVIGIDHYQHAGLAPLTAAESDARRVAAILEKQGFSIERTLFGKAATRAAITSLLKDELEPKLRQNDRLIVYFAGHGVSRRVNNVPTGFLMASDSERDRPEETGINMAEVQRWLADYPAKHVLFAADACYAGLSVTPRSVSVPPGPSYVKAVASLRARIVLVAGSESQLAYEVEGSGVFTKAFIAGIDGKADSDRDDVVSGTELAAYVKREVSAEVWEQFGAKQHPHYRSLGEGDFLFLLPAFMKRYGRSPVIGKTAVVIGVPRLGESPSREEMREYTAKAHNHALDRREYVGRMLDAKRREDDVRSLCLDDKYSQLNLVVETLDDRRTQVLATNDPDRVRHNLTVIEVLTDRATLLAIEADYCIGKEVQFMGEDERELLEPSESPPTLELERAPRVAPVTDRLKR